MPLTYHAEDHLIEMEEQWKTLCSVLYPTLSTLTPYASSISV